MTTTAEPIKRRKLGHEVEDRLLAMIRRGDIRPGDTLPSERELMTTYGVGRPAIREAMQSLQRMGILEIRHGERARVAEPSFDRMVDQISETMRHLLSHSSTTLEHLKEARITFEAAMTRIAAERRAPAMVAHLRKVVQDQEAASHDTKAFLEKDGRFHRELAAISGNPIFASLSEALFGWLAQFHADLVRRPGLEKLTIAEHHSIVDAIEAGDVALAERHMRDHLNRANSLYEQGNLQRDG